MYEKLVKEQNLKDVKPRIVFARDTRASGPRLVAALTAALDATDTEYTDYKLLTTPQLHYITRCLNTQGTPFDYGVPTEEGYYEKTATAFKKAMQGRKPSGGLTVDCANGVGGPKLRELVKFLPPISEGGLEIRIVNDDVVSPERLNSQVLLYRCCELLDTDSSSAERISSRPVNGHHRLPRLNLWRGVHPWMETQIVSYSTSWMQIIISAC